jgi:hypothetical protein
MQIPQHSDEPWAHWREQCDQLKHGLGLEQPHCCKGSGGHGQRGHLGYEHKTLNLLGHAHGHAGADKRSHHPANKGGLGAEDEACNHQGAGDQCLWEEVSKLQ